MGERIGTVVPEAIRRFMCAETRVSIPLIQKLAKKRVLRTLNLTKDLTIVLMMENAIRQEDFGQEPSTPSKRRVMQICTCWIMMAC